MTLFQSILLGIIQGITEFIPVSSSAHLVIVPYLFGWELPAEEAFSFDVLVQVASAIGALVYFWREATLILKATVLTLTRKDPKAEFHARLGLHIVLATLPAGLFGIALKPYIAQAFNTPTLSACFLFITAILLLIADKVGKGNRTLENLTWKDALWIGFFQVLAVFPGISRSGATITGGMARGLERPTAARFSFLMSIPILLAAGFVAGVDFTQLQNSASLLPIFLPGLAAAAIVGYLSIRWLLGFLIRRPLYIFAFYCAVLGLIALL